MCTDATIELACHDKSVRTARRFVEAHVTDWAVRGEHRFVTILDDIALIVTELVSNAVRFCKGPVTLQVAAHQREVMITVGDDNPAPPAPKIPSSDAQGGRGLILVNAIADEWGFLPHPKGGKEVWARLSLPLESTATAARHVTPTTAKCPPSDSSPDSGDDVVDPFACQ